MLWSILLFPFPILIRTKKKRREHPSRCKKSQWITCNNNEIATRNPKCKKQHKQTQPICWCLMQTVRNTTIATTETISYAKQTKAMCSAQATHSSKQHILLCHVVECNTHQTTPPSNTIFIKGRSTRIICKTKQCSAVAMRFLIATRNCGQNEIRKKGWVLMWWKMLNE